MNVLFTATEDLSEEMNEPTFREALEAFLKKHVGGRVIVKESVQFDTPVNAEPGDPADLV
jgi:hypothetical protein